jgi:hypothetical protein
MKEHITYIFRLKSKPKKKSAEFCLLVYFLIYSLILKMEATYFTYFSKTSFDFHNNTSYYIPKDRSVQGNYFQKAVVITNLEQCTTFEVSPTKRPNTSFLLHLKTGKETVS